MFICRIPGKKIFVTNKLKNIAKNSIRLDQTCGRNDLPQTTTTMIKTMTTTATSIHDCTNSLTFMPNEPIHFILNIRLLCHTISHFAFK